VAQLCVDRRKRFDTFDPVRSAAIVAIHG